MATGNCLCEKIKVEADLDLRIMSLACHCDSCKRHSGTAFDMYYVLPESAVRLLSGSPKEYVSTTKLDKVEVTRAFCPDCGSRILCKYSTFPGYVAVKPGMFGSEADLSGATHTWLSEKMPGYEVPAGVTGFMEGMGSTKYEQ